MDAPATPRSDGASLPAISRVSLQSPYEARGFAFQRAQLGDGRERWVAASPDGLALVEIVGTDTVEQASVTVFGPIRQREDDGAQRAIYMLTMMNTILPEWTAGVEWFSGELATVAIRAGNYMSEITQAGVRAVFSFDAQLGATTLSFGPE
ncbi:MAG: hypothetical protein ACT4QE_05230 [Anaerolineales bacterium]